MNLIAIGGGIFLVGMIIVALNTRMRYGFFTHYESHIPGLTVVGVIMVIVGLAMAIITAWANGQLGH
ncbi:hypothetical protein FC50_GL001749 [Lacticaseibacillus pantheris DSM 15945 = JCM 12539 = NBRC 106106]|uniref:Uncharacterized protein n=1 Tax=Lacticaseibacillus pantheris DSM 15945 = JCM 12539 = NBRC 106106 TaxID=1423783 RepID=A0A0R1U2W4_9LACO|nr:hypothetical protein [Lacticaseibacillus pantheris]KRL85576.1 hypothetical protein FC50_GL001749 [Lacticaseibacillus pantheris DSM 15945 = JCM 12539 = NBRC 106106]